MPKRRRGHGEGAIYQRESDGLWCTSVDLGIINGKRKRKVIYGKTRKEVVEKLKALHRDQAAGINLSSEEITVKAFLEHWLEHSVKRRNRQRTYDKYKADVTRHIIPAIGSILLTKLTPDHVQAMLNSLSDQGRSPRTVSNVRAALRKALNQAMRRGHVVRNVATLVDAPRSSTFTITPLDLAQARKLLDAVAGHRLEALYRVALSLGMRRGEVCGLRWKDVNFIAATLSVKGSLQRFGGKLQWTALKTAASVRTLALPPVLLDALKRHQARQAQERADAEDWVDSGYVFVSTRGTPLEPHNVVRHFKSVLRRTGLPETVRFHDLRHSCATLLIAQGVHLSVIKDILGHTQISTTANVYGHVLPDIQRDAASRLDDLLGPQPPAEGESTGESISPEEGGQDAGEDETEDGMEDGEGDDTGDGSAEAADGSG
jgi:integrase